MHERLRRHSHAAAREVYEHGRENDLLSRLRADPAFAKTPWPRVLDVKRHVGLAPRQTRAFLRDVIGPVRKRFRGVGRREVEIQV